MAFRALPVAAYPLSASRSDTCGSSTSVEAPIAGRLIGDARQGLLLAGPEQRRWLVLCVLLSAPFLAVLDVFAFNLALPSIQDSLHASNSSLLFVSAGYALAYAALLITGGRLGDIHGRRRTFLFGVAFFALTSGQGALAPSAGLLIAARVCQGAAAALMYPQVLSLIHVGFAGRDRAAALSVFSVTQGLAMVAAQLVGGAIVQADLGGLGWRPILLINLPVCLVAGLLALRLIPESKAAGAPSLDLAGVAIAAGCLLGLVAPLILGGELGWPAWVWPAIGAAVAAGALFVWHERRLTRRGGSPLVALDLFRARTFVVGLALTLLLYAGQQSSWFVLTLYLQHGLHLPPLTAGLVVTPLGLGFVSSSLLSPHVLRRLGRHTLSLGAAALTASTAALSLWPPPALDGGLLLPLAGSGVGFGLVIPVLIGVVLRTVPSDHAGAASGLMVTAQRASGALGIAIVGLVFLGSLKGGYAAAFSHALWFQVLSYAGAAVLVWLLKE
jgi:MFS family permease